MTKYIITLSDEKAAPSFLKLIKNVNFIKEVVELSDDKPLTDEDWIKPGRPATDEEFEKMISEMEKEEKEGAGMVAEEAREYVTKQINEWRKK